MNSPKIAIIGANGYLGRHLVAACYNEGLSPTLYGSQETHIDGKPNYRQLDFLTDRKLEALDTDVDLLFFFAGKTGTTDGFEQHQTYLDLNHAFLLATLEKIRNSSARPKVIFPSSRLVYKGKKNTPLTETDENEAKTIYAVSKLSGEQYLALYHNAFAIPYSIVRICVPYGNAFDTSFSYGTIGALLSQIKKDNHITLFGDGSQRRSVIHVNDLAEAILTASLSKKTDNRIYNLGGPEQFSIKELADMIARKTNGVVASVPWPELHQRIESGDTIFDSSLIEKLVPITYQYSFSQWLDEFFSQ